MKKTWEELGEQVHKLQSTIQEIIEVLPNSPAMYKRERQLKADWEKFKRLFNKFDGFVTPVAPVNVKEPWNDPEFLETWKYWKDYLIEQHGVFIRSRSEVMALKQLKDITENNPQKAIKYLEYAISGRYQNFFKLDEEQDKIEVDGKSKTVFKLS